MRLNTIGFDSLKKFAYNIFGLYEEAGFMPNIKSSTDLRNNYNESRHSAVKAESPFLLPKMGSGIWLL